MDATTDALTFERRDDLTTDRDSTVFVLSGPAGAVTFTVGATRSHSIEVHSRSPLFKVEDRPRSDACEVIGGPCWWDLGYSAADRLHEAWEVAGFDDAVVEAALRDWYQSRIVEAKPRRAEELPVGAVVATEDEAYVRRFPNFGYVWRGTDGSELAANDIDDLLAAGVAEVLRPA